MTPKRIKSRFDTPLNSLRSGELGDTKSIEKVLSHFGEEILFEIENLESSLQMARNTIESSLEGIMVVNSEGNITEYNQKFLNIWDLTTQDIASRDAETIYKKISQFLRHSSEFQLQLDQHICGDLGSFNCYQLLDGRFIEITGYLNKEFAIVWCCSDATEKKHYKHQLRYQSEYDKLTGLPNNLIFNDRLEQAILRCEESDSTRTAVIALNIDHIEKINDSIGQSHADKLIHEVSRRLAQCLRSADTICRKNGDEFLILIDKFHAQAHVTELAQRILKTVSAPISIEGELFHTTASLGISVYPNDSEDGDTLVKFAYIALRKAKELGRNNYHFFTKYLELYAKHRVDIENQLHEAIAKRQFIVHYQPVFNAKTDTIKNFEALVRWNSPTKGLIAPASFIPIAEDTGLIKKISAIVVKDALQQLKRWQEMGYTGLQVAINLSARQFADGTLAEDLLREVEEHDLSCECIILEITESMLLMNLDKTIKILNKFRQMGFQIAMDDFGTGYSSLSYLRQLPVDIIKLDRSFCHDLPNNNRDIAIARNIIALINDLGLAIVAEGVEEKPSLDFLVINDCYLIQGYYFSRPLPQDEATALLGKCWEKPQTAPQSLPQSPPQSPHKKAP